MLLDQMPKDRVSVFCANFFCYVGDPSTVSDVFFVFPNNRHDLSLFLAD